MTVGELIKALVLVEDWNVPVLGCDYPIGGIDEELSDESKCVLILNLP